jgi:flagellar basal-body rod protein FlgG
MLEGLYTAAAGMAAQQQRMDALSNDVANVNTAGYKRVRIGFRDLIYQQDGTGGPRTGSGAAATILGRTFDEGSLQQTGNTYDLAIEGEGFFQVQHNGQTVLTRQGNFLVDARGEIVTPNGDRLIPPITIPAGIDPSTVTIGPDGTVIGAGRRLGQIQLMTVPSPTGLNPIGNGYYAVTTASGGTARVTGTRIQQGALEASDVNLADTMVDMLDAQRSYSMASKAIHMQDQMMEIANGVKQ